MAHTFDAATQAGLLFAIRANPADDLVRLAYADWLDETGVRAAEGAAAVIREWIGRSHAPRVFAPGEAASVPAGANSSERVVAAPGMSGVSYTFHRGFVSGVRCESGLFLGQECARCDGARRDARIREESLAAAAACARTILMPPPGRITGCPGCGGTGRVGDLAGPLFGFQPITAVAFTDIVPRGLERWHTFSLARDGQPCGGERVPEPLWSDGLAAYFESRGDADAALSRSAVAFARRLAGLPPLTGSPPPSA